MSNDIILKLKNALDTSPTVEVRSALLDAIHQIKRYNQQNGELKKQIAELNSKHTAVSNTLKNCLKLLDGERINVVRK